jgi:histidine kinase
VSLSSYEVSTLVHTDGRFSLYRARDPELGSFLLKTSHRTAAGAALVAFARDFRIARQHTGAHVLSAHRLQVLEDGVIAQVRADWAGFSVEELLAQRLPPGYVLRLMQALLDAVEALHADGLLLRDVRPSNFLHDEKIRRVTLVDCSEAVPLTEASSSPPSDRSPYHAPEVAVEGHWTPDRRSDFYGIGVIAYRALTGATPEPDVERRVRASESEVLAPGVPQPLSALILKLLANNPGDRYQTAAGLRADLSRCAEEWQSFGDITSFPLGSLDAKGKLRFPPTIYGQADARAGLQRAFALASDGRRQFAVLSGAAGAGKSALLRELQQTCASSDALVICGKWDQFQREAAFAGLAQVCLELVERARTLASEEFEQLRRTLGEALGENAGLLVDLVPELGELVRASALSAGIGAGERQNRVGFCFAELFRALGSLPRPVVVCLEDLHWADAASRSVVAALGSISRDLRLFTVVTFRSGGVHEPELAEFLSAVGARGQEYEHHGIRPLTQQDVAKLLCDTLSSDAATTEPLGNVLWGLSQGNPFTLREILSYLHGQGALIFDAKSGRWVWDLDEIGPTAVPHDVADILSLRVQELSARQRAVLEAAACVGDRFDATTVAELRQERVDDVVDALRHASQVGLVGPLPSREPNAGGTPSEFVFRHDRIRQAVYRGTEEARRIGYHSALGQQLLARHQQTPAVATLLEAVAHLNHVPEPAPNVRMAQLNLDAAIVAKRSSSHDTAASLLRVALSQMGDSPWAVDRGLTFRIVAERAEAEYLADQPAVADALFEEALANASSDDERLWALQRRLEVRSNGGRFADAAADGVACLKLLGVSLPVRPKPSSLIFPLIAVLFRHHRLGKNLELVDVRQVPAKIRQAIECLAHLWGPAFWSDENLTGLVVLKLLRMSLDSGNTPASSIAYSCYGVFLAEVFGRRKQGQSVCRLGWILAQQAHDPLYMWRARFMYLAFFAHYDAPLLAGVQEFRAAMRGSMSVGDYPYAGSCANLILYILPAAGVPFVDVHREIAVLSGLARQVEEDRTIVTVEIVQRWMAILERKREHDDVPKFTLDIFRGGAQYANERGTFYLFELSLLVLLGRYDAAVEVAKKLRGSKMLSGYFKAYFHFYLGVALAQAAGLTRKPPKRLFRKCMRVIGAHEACYAVNYRHKTLLLRALEARATGSWTETVAKFEAAARSAQEDGFPHHAALAWELAAELCQQRGDSSAALRHLASARLSYVEWGCLVKVEATDRALARMAPGVGQLPAPREQGAAVLGEFGSVLAAARALSAEADPERIMQKLLAALLTHTGATRVVAAIVREEELLVDSEADLDERGDVRHRAHGEPLTRFAAVPQTVLRYTQRLGASVLLDSDEKRRIFARDSYVAARSEHAFASVPMVWLNKCVGVLSLENRLTPDAFTPSKVAAAELLAGQAAATLQSAWEHRERLAVLQTRMNPHFLYNALNSIAEMTVTQPDAAEGAIIKLADLYRFLTAAPGSNLIRLRDEVGFVRSYLQLEKLRYGARLSFDILVSGDLDSSLIPPLLLQPLVENAVHHGAASRPEGGRVTVTVNVTDQRVHLRVADTGSGVARGGTGTGMGLGTTRNRLELCFGPEAEMHVFNEGGAVIDISFPHKRLQ